MDLSEKYPNVGSIILAKTERNVSDEIIKGVDIYTPSGRFCG